MIVVMNVKLNNNIIARNVKRVPIKIINYINPALIKDR